MSIRSGVAAAVMSGLLMVQGWKREGAVLNAAVLNTAMFDAAMARWFDTAIRHIRHSRPPRTANAIARQIRTHFINRREMRSSQKGRWQGVRRSQRPFWEAPGGSGLFGRIAA